MNKKSTMRLNESRLKQIVTESIKKILDENAILGQDEIFSTTYSVVLKTLTKVFGKEYTVEGDGEERISIIPEDGYGVSVKINFTMF